MGRAMNAAVLEGELQHFFATEVLQLLGLARATGRLELARGEERADLYVEDGRPVFARTTGVSVRLGDVLVHRGDIRPEAVEFALAMQKDQPGERLGEMLVRSGALSPEQVKIAVIEVQRRILYGVLLWQEGRFRFLPGERVEAEDIQLDLELDRLILEGLRIADQARSR
ncbi:MAG: hypothetical protein A2V63_04425 [Candidatus Eisenbacteria bacterium RBG_19FT_COMBO_70_11]|nr:MAG: hypothetical protein A2V63_04425 [Candidatus Eisenbacteria bacterium RBG_19FT_COMBO_70_11]